MTLTAKETSPAAASVNASISRTGVKLTWTNKTLSQLKAKGHEAEPEPRRPGCGSRSRLPAPSFATSPCSAASSAVTEALQSINELSSDGGEASGGVAGSVWLPESGSTCCGGNRLNTKTQFGVNRRFTQR